MFRYETLKNEDANQAADGYDPVEDNERVACIGVISKAVRIATGRECHLETFMRFGPMTISVPNEKLYSLYGDYVANQGDKLSVIVSVRVRFIRGENDIFVPSSLAGTIDSKPVSYRVEVEGPDDYNLIEETGEIPTLDDEAVKQIGASDPSAGSSSTGNLMP